LGPPLVDSFDGEEQQEEAEPVVVAVGRGGRRNGGAKRRLPAARVWLGALAERGGESQERERIGTS
jgi:hypothetical protein